MKKLMLKKRQLILLCVCYCILFTMLGIIHGSMYTNDKAVLYTVFTNNIVFYLIVFFFSYMNTDVIRDYHHSNILLRYSTKGFFVEQACVEMIRLIVLIFLMIASVIIVNFRGLNILLYIKLAVSLLLFFMAVNFAIKILYVFTKNITLSFSAIYSIIILISIFVDNLRKFPVTTKFICLFPLFEITISQEIMMFILLLFLNLFLFYTLCFIFKRKDGGLERYDI